MIPPPTRLPDLAPIAPLQKPPSVQSAPRRKLLADLDRVAAFFNPNLQDSLSPIIQQWHANFTKALRERRDKGLQESDDERLNRILGIHLKQLQQLLVDPLTNTPLDSQAVLGSDGKIYGYKSIHLCMARLPPELRQRSPLHPNLEAPFTIRRHPLIQHMVGFLREWNALSPSQMLEADFEAYFSQNPLPVIPETPDNSLPLPGASAPPPVSPPPSIPPPAPRPLSNPPPRTMRLSDLRARDAAEAVHPERVNQAPSAPYREPRMMTLSALRAREAAQRANPALAPRGAPSAYAQGHSHMVTLADLRAAEAPAADHVAIHLPPEEPAPPEEFVAPPPMASSEEKVPEDYVAPPPIGLSEAEVADLRNRLDEDDELAAEEEPIQAEALQNFSNRLESMIGTFREGMQQQFAPVRERRAAFAEEITQVVGGLQAQNTQDLAELQNEIDHTEREIADVRYAIEHLPPQIDSNQRELLLAKLEDLELQRDIKQLDKVVSKRRQSNWSSLAGALALSLGCGALTLLAPQLAPYWKMAFTPMKWGVQGMIQIPA